MEAGAEGQGRGPDWRTEAQGGDKPNTHQSLVS